VGLSSLYCGHFWPIVLPPQNLEWDKTTFFWKCQCDHSYIVKAILSACTGSHGVFTCGFLIFPSTLKMEAIRPSKTSVTPHLHCATNQKAAFFMVTAMKTSNLTIQEIFVVSLKETVKNSFFVWPLTFTPTHKTLAESWGENLQIEHVLFMNPESYFRTENMHRINTGRKLEALSFLSEGNWSVRGLSELLGPRLPKDLKTILWTWSFTIHLPHCLMQWFAIWVAWTKVVRETLELVRVQFEELLHNKTTNWCY
jgi:hypothetical protein